MANRGLGLDGRISPNGAYLAISPEDRFRIDSAYYRTNGLGEPGLMPRDMVFSDRCSGIEDTITENIGVETFGGLTLQTKEGALGPTELTFVSHIERKGQEYVLRHGTYKKDSLFVLYLLRSISTPELAGIGVCNFEEKHIAKLVGLGIYDRFRNGGHGTAFLAGIERACAPTNMLMLLHNPLRQAVPFYVRRGYRILEHPNGPNLAKALHPLFDESLLLGRS